jgi:hypothetical protein
VTVFRNLAFGMATGVRGGRSGHRGSILDGAEISSSPQCPHRLWGPLSLLSSGYRGFFHWVQSDRKLNLITHLQLIPMLNMHGSRELA